VIFYVDYKIGLLGGLTGIYVIIQIFCDRAINKFKIYSLGLDLIGGPNWVKNYADSPVFKFKNEYFNDLDSLRLL